MIVLFTDFGPGWPLCRADARGVGAAAPGTAVIDLFHDVPSFDIRAAAYLLPAYTRGFPPGTVFVCVVDPGVGSEHLALIVKVDHRWYVGPTTACFMSWHGAHGIWNAMRFVATGAVVGDFHGRDLFAPVAAQLVHGLMPDSVPAVLTPPVPTGRRIYRKCFISTISGMPLPACVPTALRVTPDFRLAARHWLCAYYSGTEVGNGFGMRMLTGWQKSQSTEVGPVRNT